VISTRRRFLPALKIGCKQVADDVPGLARAVEQGVEVGAREAVRAGQGDTREEQGLGLADVGRGGGEPLLGLQDVGPPVEKRRGQADGTAPGASARRPACPRGTAPGFAAEEHG
jgi:hypothetical protein